MTTPLLMIARLGLRNLLRYRRRNAMLCLAVAIGLGTLLFASAFLRGWETSMREDAIDAFVGDLKVTSDAWLRDPVAEHGFTLPDDVALSLDSARVIWTTRLLLPAVIQSERETRGVQLAGIDPADEAHMSFVRKVVITGRALADADDTGLVLGRELARRLDTGEGKRVVLSLQDPHGRNREFGFRVVGIFDAEGTGMELAFALTGRAALQKKLDATDLQTEVSLRLPDPRAVHTWQQTLRDALPGLVVNRWEQLMPQISELIGFSNSAIWIWYAVLLTALAFGIANTFIAAVLERTRELGLMQVLGMKRSLIVLQVVIESMWIMVVGLALGVILGTFAVWYFSDGIDLSRWAAGAEMFGLRAVMVPRLVVADVQRAVVTMLLLGLAASLYPAWRAVRLNGLEALRGRT
ncbi:MAG: ABC transporter permease [Pseudomonadales bacterium]|nr:ABC transporter permease [Pseudomonadales bacterium]MCP5182374.1 ABC transporter permease [Pseudomonadales bacterium]